MKRTILLFLSVMMAVIMTAGDVTPQQALQQAQKFLQQTPSGMKRSQAEVPQLKMAGRVSGLYVFNAEQNQGYVIVSNDDRTTPILGYSETGTLDPDNMPCNMRAWLQGYADEIAWLNEHNIQSATSQAPRRTASAVKTPIIPLVQTHWDQDSPYNALCPEYSSEKCVTGCVATAMAQVMYYTATKAGVASSSTTADIAGYTTSSYGLTVDAIPAGYTLDWDKMTPTYNDGSSNEAKTAVAQLMKACGASVGMDYCIANDGGSNASGISVPNALKNYFGYATTTQYADRSSYSYSNWIELLYHELNEGRAIFYQGVSTGGGHAFVCDGYQGEDFFHINWGWGGQSDDYFKLSALNPYEQGIGGSSSTDGFNTGQGAVVGAQLVGETGTVLSNPNSVNLKLNSVSIDKTTLTIGESADITFSITNSSSDDYDGEISLVYLEQGLGHGKMFLIPAGETKDCVIEFMPNMTGTYKITACRPVESGYYYSIDESKTVIVTVNAGSSSPTTDNITLAGSLTVENSENTGGLYYNLYGKEVNGVLRVNNPNTTYDYSGTFQFDVYFTGDNSLVWRFVDNVLIPAGGYIDIPVAFSGNLGSSYLFAFVYIKNGDWSDWVVAGYYTIKPGIAAYKSDGTYTVTKVTSDFYAAPANILAVDITGTGITSATSAEPNCLFIIGDGETAPTGVGNTIVKSGSTYTADNITLTDGNDFYSPIDFTATNIEFTYDNDRWADGTKGWNTIMLPFDVSSVTANGTAIDWFHSGSDTDKQFWLKEFVSDEPGVVNFDYVSGTMKANTPYIIALPGNHWGSEYNLSGKTIKFIGTNAEVKKSAPAVVTGGNYRFVGDTKAVTTENIYCINTAGNKFELKATGGSPAFRPFFKADMFDRTLTSLGIGNGGETTGISNVRSEKEEGRGDIFDLSGRRVENPTKGVYIKNGKLFIKK